MLFQWPFLIYKVPFEVRHLLFDDNIYRKKYHRIVTYRYQYESYGNSIHLKFIKYSFFTMFKRLFSSTTRALEPHLKKNLSKLELQQQKLYKRNQTRLESMESSNKEASNGMFFNSTNSMKHKVCSYKRPSMTRLKKIGDDARIEQNRPDDGVY